MQEYSDTYAVYRESKKHLVKRQTDTIDLTGIGGVSPVHIFLGGRDTVCKHDGGVSLSKQLDGNVKS